MVGFGPPRWTITAGKGTPTVAVTQCHPLGRGEQPCAAAQVEGKAQSSQHLREDPGLTGEPAQLGCTDPGAEGGRPGSLKIAA